MPAARCQRCCASAVPATSRRRWTRLWLRCAAVDRVCAMGVATLLTGVGDLPDGGRNETAAWVLYGVAGVVTVAWVGIARGTSCASCPEVDADAS